MTARIIGLQDWFQTPPGRYLMAWEREQFAATVADMFGYHALQLGLPELDALAMNRMPHRWVAVMSPASLQARPASLQSTSQSTAPSGPSQASSPNLSPSQIPVALVTDFSALPFPNHSLDLVVLPHSLELNVDPHGALREVERVLVPEGRVVICGFNPTSLWGWRQRRAHLYERFGTADAFLPQHGEFIGYWRLRDWLRLLSFEVETGRFGCYRPAVTSQPWLQRFAWMDRAGERWWPIFGAAYFLVAVKRTRGMRLMGASWKASPQRVGNPVSVANRAQGPGPHH